jgi:hypothetical protein
MPAQTPTPIEDPIEQLSGMLYGYTEHQLRYMDRALVWTDTGLARAASVVGYIIGMRDGGNPEFAEQLAKDFLRNLERLVPDHKIPVEEGSEHKVPATICEIRDDGTFHGFSLAWYTFNRELLGCAQPAERCIDWGLYPKCEYRFIYNGGLIYHGPRAGQTFTVTLEPCLWSVHT